MFSPQIITEKSNHPSWIPNVASCRNLAHFEKCAHWRCLPNSSVFPYFLPFPSLFTPNISSSSSLNLGEIMLLMLLLLLYSKCMYPAHQINMYIVQQLQQNGLGLSRNLERYVYVLYNGRAQRRTNWPHFRNCIPVDWFKKSATSTLYLAGKKFWTWVCVCVCVLWLC